MNSKFHLKSDLNRVSFTMSSCIEQNSEKKSMSHLVTQMYLTLILKINTSYELAPISDVVPKLDHK